MTNTLLDRYQQAQALEQGVLTNRIVLNDTVHPHWIGDTDYFWYKQDTCEGKHWRLVDAAAASNESAFNHLSLAAALESAIEGARENSIDPANLPIVVSAIDLSPRQIHFRAFNQLWLFKEAGNSLIQRDQTDIIPLPGNHLTSPNGNLCAFVRDYNLWVRDIHSGEERALTEDGCADYAYAVAPSLLNFPLTKVVQALWSPDSQTLLTVQLDIRKVATREIIYHVPQDGSTRPQLSEYKSAYPGDQAIESYRLVAINVSTGEQQPANYSPLTVCRFGMGFFSNEKFGWWATDNRRANFVDVVRGAQTVRVVEFNTQTGATRVLFEETSDTTVRLNDNFEMGAPPLLLPLPDTEELLWYSERSGWGHLYLYDLNTGLLKRQLTQGKWLVRNILHTDTHRRELLIQTAGRDSNINPYYRDICRLHLDTGVLTPLVSGPLEFTVLDATAPLVSLRAGLNLDSPDVNGVSPSGNYLVTTRSRVDTVPVSLLIDREGSEVLTLETAFPIGLPSDWHWPEPVKAKAADGDTDLYGVIYRPPGFSSEKSYPVVDFFSCGHPDMSNLQHSSFSNGPLFGLPWFRAAALSALGFIVVTLEGRGTPYRNKAFKDTHFGDIVGANSFEDHITGLHQLAEQYPSMDLGRVGIIAPDSLTAPVYGLLQYPEFYKVGVAVGFQDLRFSAGCLTETLESSQLRKTIPYAEELVENLQGKLLLVHGLLDTVSAPTGAFRLIDALQRANKNVDMLILPNLGHDLPSYVLRRSWDYLVTHLQGEKPPKEFKLTKGIELIRQAQAAESQNQIP